MMVHLDHLDHSMAVLAKDHRKPGQDRVTARQAARVEDDIADTAHTEREEQREPLMKIIRTVLGDVPADKAGITLTHEHILYAYPGADLDHRTVFDFDEIAGRIARDLRLGLEHYGIATLVEMTPAEVYRHPALMRAVAEASGVNIIAITGFFPQSMGLPYYWRRQTIEEITNFFIADLTEGMMYAGRPTGIRAGALKIATGGEGVSTKPSPVGPDGLRITEIEQRVVRAVGRAQRTIGCAINTHTDPNDYAVTNPGMEQLDLLEDEGADLDKGDHRPRLHPEHGHASAVRDLRPRGDRQRRPHRDPLETREHRRAGRHLGRTGLRSGRKGLCGPHHLLL